MPPHGFSAATVLDQVRAGATLRSIADGHSMDEIAGAVRDALTGLRLGISSLDDAGLRRVAGLELWSIAEVAGHVLKMDAAANAIARSLAIGQRPSAPPPYGEPGDRDATRVDLLAGIHAAEERLAGAVRDALTGLRLGISSIDDAGLRRVAGLELWSIAEVAGHVLKMDAAANAIARSLAVGQPPSGPPPYGEPGDRSATHAQLLAGIHSAEERLAGARILAAGGPTFPHDELGPLDARAWILFSGLHAAAHLHQAAAIVRAR